jgi:hypothetical protein
MKNIFILIMAISLNSFAISSPVEDMIKILPAGRYNAITTEGEACAITVNHDSQNYAMTVTPASFEFDKDSGSTECMYTKTCINIVKDTTKIISVKKSDLKLSTTVKRPGRGAPDYVAAKEMSATIEKTAEGLKISVSEQIGIFNWGSAKAICIIR